MLTLIALTQERKVIIFATTRSNTMVDKRRAMGFLQNRRRMNGELRVWNFMDYSKCILASGHHARSVTAHRGRRPGGPGEGRIVAHIPELRLLAQRMDREAARVEPQGNC